MSNPTIYWLSTGGEASGPFTADQIREMHRSGAIPATAMVCPRGGTVWQPSMTLIDMAKQHDAHVGTYRVLGILLGLIGVHNLYAGEMGRFLGKLGMGGCMAFLFFVGHGMEAFGGMLFALLAVWTLMEVISGPSPRDSRPSPRNPLPAPPVERTPEEERKHRRDNIIIVAVLLAVIAASWGLVIWG